MHWATAMAAGGCRFVYVRDEHNALAAAMAWARETRQVGVATVTCGPGVTQLMTALPAAVRARLPVVVFAGEAPLRKPWYNQKIEQRPFVEACGAHYHALHAVDQLETGVRDAFALAVASRCPVVLGVPFDFQEEVFAGEPAFPDPACDHFRGPEALQPDAQAVAAALPLIAAARRIVVLAGLGVLEADAVDACRRLADRAHALLATTLPARGLFHEDPFDLGIAGGFATQYTRQRLQQADLIIAVGARLAQHTSDAGKLWPAQQVLHIDIEPRHFSQGREVAGMHIRGDARLTLEALHDALEPTPDDEVTPSGTAAADWRCEATASAIESTPVDDHPVAISDGLLDPRDVIKTLDQLLPKDWHLVNSSGHCSWFAAQMFGRPASHFFTLREFGAIGNGIAFALGIAVARPERSVVLFDGDGSFLMHVQELETLKRHGLKVLICVLNDAAYGSEIHKLRADGLPEDGAAFERTDCAAIARGFGLGGERVDSLEQLPGLLQQFAEATTSTAMVWDFQLSDQVVSPVIRRSHGG